MRDTRPTLAPEDEAAIRAVLAAPVPDREPVIRPAKESAPAWKIKKLGIGRPPRKLDEDWNY